VFAIPVQNKLTEIFQAPPSRLAVIAALALCATASAWTFRYRAAGWAAFAVAAILPFALLPRITGPLLVPSLHTPELKQLSEWARAQTDRDAVFLFPDAARELYPGVFRAEALRAVYTDWKAGGQVNYHARFAEEWWQRWQKTMLPRFDPRKADGIMQVPGVDYVVVQAKNRLPDREPVFENSLFVAYRLSSASTSPRVGADACAPRRVTETAAAAFANRMASAIGRDSERATASAALNVSPAAVVSRTSTSNPGLRKLSVAFV
jgi:hypothetical protein